VVSERFGVVRAFMRRHTIEVLLPAGWEAISEETHAYRRCGVNGGRLRLSLAPPHPDYADRGALLVRLRELLAAMGQDTGEELTHAQGSCSLGASATTLRGSAERGLMQFWLVAGDVTVFASYIMGDLDAAQKDLVEAQQIMSTLQLQELP
jgi:hypothetical protein